jgi:RecA-family ATPase
MNVHTKLITLDEAERLEKMGAKTQPKAARLFSAKQLGKTEFAPIKFIIPGYVPEGCAILAGRPKLGKSWLALDLALAVARGSYCLGNVECVQGDVLYLALEDNQRRLKSRVNKVSAGSDDPWPEALDFATEWDRCDQGGLAAIRAWIESKANPRLVIVDVLAQFRSRAVNGSRDTQYESDYQTVKGLQELASEFGIAVIIVHHVRKGAGDVDPFERVSGTMGLTGAADTTIILDRDGNGCTLYARGRDIEEYEKAITFNKDECRWIVQGEAVEVRRTDERAVILDALLEADEAMTVKDISVATGMNRNGCDQLLFKMGKAGEVLKAKRGQYIHPDRTDLIEADTPTPDKIDKKIRNEPDLTGSYDSTPNKNDKKIRSEDGE